MTIPTRGEIYTKLLENIRMAEEHSATMGHLHNTEDGIKDKALAHGWLQMSEMFRQIGIKVTNMAKGRLN